MTTDNNESPKSKSISDLSPSLEKADVVNPTDNKFPKDFDPNSYDHIPTNNEIIFDKDNPDLETLGRNAIRSALEKKLGCKVVSRSEILNRSWLSKRGFTQDDILYDRVKVR